jgi:hypothetical protein
MKPAATVLELDGSIDVQAYGTWNWDPLSTLTISNKAFSNGIWRI